MQKKPKLFLKKDNKRNSTDFKKKKHKFESQDFNFNNSKIKSN